MVESQRRVLEAYGTRFDHGAPEQRDVRDTARPREAIEFRGGNSGWLAAVCDHQEC